MKSLHSFKKDHGGAGLLILIGACTLLIPAQVLSYLRRVKRPPTLSAQELMVEQLGEPCFAR